MRRLNVAACGFGRLHLAQFGPEFRVRSQRFHNNTVTRRCFRMAWSPVVLFEYRMMNDCRRSHCCTDPHINRFTFISKTYDNKTTNRCSSYEPAYFPAESSLPSAERAKG